MRSFLKERELVLKELYDEIYKIYPRDMLIQSIKKLILDVKSESFEDNLLLNETLDGVLSKTETYNILLTLYELDKRTEWDHDLLEQMKDVSYNQHRTIALNICDMYGSGATSLFGYVDCTFRAFFPNKHPKSFLSKGVSALIASTTSSLISSPVDENYTNKNIELLSTRGVQVQELIEMVFDLQSPYNSSLTIEECEKHVLGVLSKQQTYHTIDLCIRIDKGVENKEFGEQFQEIVGNDEGLYGIDESVNTSVSKLYGMIAITNFGYLDKAKPGIIGKLDSDHEGDHCNTFLDDTVCALVSAACARLAHNNANTNSKPKS